jgi:xanthine dehydrogenase iron-sulfur cluster and FAD-binding subunit A
METRSSRKRKLDQEKNEPNKLRKFDAENTLESDENCKYIMPGIIMSLQALYVEHIHPRFYPQKINFFFK